MGAIEDYFAALERLKKNVPVRQPKDTRISKDSVALEAGRKRSSIKKSRPMFEALVNEIEIAAAIQNKPKQNAKAILEKTKADKNRYRDLYHQALNRELMLIKRIAYLDKQ